MDNTISPAKYYTQEITIQAEPSLVWDALINPDWTKQYMFGCEPITDWEVGSKLVWRGAFDGMDYVVGEVKHFEPEKKLVLTSFNPHGNLPDLPEHYLTGEYELSYQDGHTTLRIRQGDFATVGEGAQRFREAEGAWAMTLNKLKEILEA